MKEIYDSRGLFKGYKVEAPNRVTYLSADGRIVGWYAPSIDETYTANGSYLGKGDVGACLL